MARKVGLDGQQQSKDEQSRQTGHADFFPEEVHDSNHLQRSDDGVQHERRRVFERLHIYFITRVLVVSKRF